MKTLILSGAALTLLVACGAEQGYSEREAVAPGAMGMMDMVASSPAPSEMHFDQAERKAVPVPVASEEEAGPTAASGPMLAYTHNRSIEASSSALGSITEGHQQQCDAAGPQVCMVVNSSQSGIGEEWGSASLHIKATPQWTEAFLGGLESELEGTTARITSASTYAEDLSTQIIDTDARLKAKLTLRDRLQALLTDRPSELGDLIDLERELARVQADIDSSSSILAELRQRVALSNLHMNYSARQEPRAHSVWRPFTSSLSEFTSNFASALGAVITAVAFILPWIPVGIGLIWLARMLWRRVFRKKPELAEAES